MHNTLLCKVGNELPRLVYVSREKRPGFNHHKKVSLSAKQSKDLCWALKWWLRGFMKLWGHEQ
ncbi:hypothetical protein IFM89_024069, partial [Coptis chinensis]